MREHINAILAACCGVRAEFTDPYHHRDHVYATDGVIVVRTRWYIGRNAADAAEGVAKGSHELPWANLALSEGSWSYPPSWPERLPDVPCAECEGTGYDPDMGDHVCPECDGSRRVCGVPSLATQHVGGQRFSGIYAALVAVMGCRLRVAQPIGDKAKPAGFVGDGFEGLLMPYKLDADDNPDDRPDVWERAVTLAEAIRSASAQVA